MSGDSMTANHVGHEIATFLGSLGGTAGGTAKRQAEEDWIQAEREVRARQQKHTA